MTLDGAEGQTRQEMLRVSHGHDDDAAWLAGMGSLSMMLNAKGDGNTLQMANRLWEEQNFRFHPTYLQRIEQMFDAPLAPLDFRGASGASRKTT
ncbi:MAG: hypothetical protein KDA99_25465, partial [Planctomycetales bacterium]|nr:hypothetical protein [Planctomycetales bacterium]